jgi:hypothetical protein
MDYSFKRCDYLRDMGIENITSISYDRNNESANEKSRQLEAVEGVKQEIIELSRSHKSEVTGMVEDIFVEEDRFFISSEKVFDNILSNIPTEISSDPTINAIKLMEGSERKVDGCSETGRQRPPATSPDEIFNNSYQKIDALIDTFLNNPDLALLNQISSSYKNTEQAFKKSLEDASAFRNATVNILNSTFETISQINRDAFESAEKRRDPIINSWNRTRASYFKQRLYETLTSESSPEIQNNRISSKVEGVTYLNSAESSRMISKLETYYRLSKNYEI